MKRSIEPRQMQNAGYYGLSGEVASRIGDTWLESESWTYPSGGMLRRARCICPDGKLRIVKCGIPDTFFSIPAYVKPFGRGFITSGEDGYRFNVYKGK